jgi:hypothetical protein
MSYFDIWYVTPRSGLATSRSVVHGVLPIVYKCKITESHKRRPRPDRAGAPLNNNNMVTSIGVTSPSYVTNTAGTPSVLTLHNLTTHFNL